MTHRLFPAPATLSGMVRTLWYIPAIPVCTAIAAEGPDAAASPPIPLLTAAACVALALVCLYLGALYLVTVSRLRRHVKKLTTQDIMPCNDRYRDLVVTLPDIIYSAAVDQGTILSLNPAFEEITGWQCSAWIGRKLTDLIHPEDIPLAQEMFAATAAGKTSHNREMRVRMSSGGFLYGEFTCTPQIEAGAVVAEFGIIRNITARKRAETEREILTWKLLQSDKMAAIGQLAGGVAHEINNPLAIILGFAQSLLKRTPPGDASSAGLQAIEREAKRCKKLVNDLLTFARAGKPEMEHGNINDVIETALTLVEAQSRFKSVELVRDLAAGLPSVTISRDQIQQVMVNLCNNALDALPQNGILTIRTRAAGTHIEIQVHDTGAGIPPEIQARIFEPFFTTKEAGKGTGLGLSLVYEIVQRHHGTITVASTPAAGTTFTILLPAA